MVSTLMRAAVAALLILACTPLATSMAGGVSHPGDSDVTGGIAGMPGRRVLDVDPGKPSHTTVSFQNRTGADIVMSISTADIAGGAKNPDEFIQVIKDAPFGARGWISISPERALLHHGDIVTVDVDIMPPADATPGSYYAAIRGNVAPPKTKTRATRAEVGAEVDIQLFFDIPGERNFEGHLEQGDSPFLFQRDLGRFLSGSVVYRNTGNVTDEISGSVTFGSILGRDVGRVPLKSGVVLRGGSRSFRYVWTATPWIGRFTPTARVHGENGHEYTKKLDPIWIVPSWRFWLLLLVVLAIPLVWRWRERRKFDRLIETLEARAGAGDEYDDDDWDSLSDEHF